MNRTLKLNEQSQSKTITKTRSKSNKQLTANSDLNLERQNVTSHTNSGTAALHRAYIVSSIFQE